MKIELSPENAAAVERYATLAGLIPTELLNRYFSDNMVALFENLRTDDLESHLCSLEFHTRVDAERVVAWMYKIHNWQSWRKMSSPWIWELAQVSEPDLMESDCKAGGEH
jgi:hypothetical protein